MIERLVFLLAALVEAVKQHFRHKEQSEAQDDRDNLEDSPADWFNDHFNGVRRDNAGEADKADANRSDE